MPFTEHVFSLTTCRSLWNMRNYIHCMLCGSTFASQLVYIVGGDRIDNEVLHIIIVVRFLADHPVLYMKAVCSAVAVLNHYLLLVICMWMLMEGVVLYVKLIKVFVTHPKRYIVFFTIASFGK